MIEYWRKSLGSWARYRDSNGNEVAFSSLLIIHHVIILKKLITIIVKLIDGKIISIVKDKFFCQKLRVRIRHFMSDQIWDCLHVKYYHGHCLPLSGDARK
jgi:hypothetical protein